MVVAAAGDPGRVRNTCIMAHVDHGKTTLADHLVAYGGGGLLNPSMAGKARFMDHLREEQERAITMKSASVLLRHRDGTRVHLIDSPGHADFCSEVSAAARVADSALIVVDAVDGLGVQTHAALRKAFAERLRPCLVLNKLDRLITDLRLDPGEAYERLHRIVAGANSVYSTLRSGSYFSLLDGPAPAQQADDGEDTFVPQKGNVVFGCARDGWGFRIQDFAAVMAMGRPGQASKLVGWLWGAYYWDKEKKKAMPLANGMKQQPMFVEFVLKRLWKVYDHGMKVDGASWLRDHLVQTFNLKVSERELQSKDRPKAVLEAVMRAWLPLAETVMTMIVECTPDPVDAQRFRALALMPERELPTWVSAEHAGIIAEAEKVRRCVVACSASSSAPVVVFVSKMFVVKHKDLPPTLNHSQEAAGEPEECFLAFARVFSGVLHAGQKVFVLSPMYDPVKGDTTGKHLKEVEVQQLYEMLGEGLRPVASVGTGNVAAIKGLGEHIMKTATLSSTRNCWPFASMAFQVSPILKVAVEPANVADLAAFREGLSLLNRADPLVEYSISEKGEHVLAAAGKVHLEHCVKNLRERFAKVELNVSEPLVSFKETIQGEGVGLIDSLKDTHGYVERIAPDGRFAVRVKVVRLPDALVKVLEENEELLSRTIKGQTARSDGAIGSQCPHDDDGRSMAVLRQDMLSAVESELEALSPRADEVKLESYRKTLLGYLHKIWALGPSQVGPNLLLMPGVKLSSGLTTIQNGREGILVRGRCHVSKKLGFVSVSDDDAEISNGIIDDSEPSTDVPDPEALRNIIISGFQEVTNAGPLCDEPMWGLAFIVEPYIFSGSPDSVNCSYQHKAAVREACRAAVLQSKPRLVEPMYFCEVTTPIERLGSVYSVLGDCRAKVQEAEMQLETFLYMVHAHLPVAESSEFSEKLWNGSSGAATARLTFSHWEAIPQDPFFVPKTKEEIEEFGDGSNMGPNLAKKLIDSVRRRKGLHVDDKVVKHGTKQRTRAKKV
ncbi:hypothetical protein CFC21_005252 [Triticum aestivum]|uniref:Elongation factor-like 1 n=2 Tax=Triticum aestivum TaxID=4565 RepID=A0A3B5YSW8_WHEAT|nr:elongation factor-like GTPase 1 [Triticum aestivum]KAF6987630.1 hypothetical protein CFC21_005252 [Triticum aestivum]